MKIVLANYRYYVSGGPEIYMFNVKRLLEEAGHTVIPYSVRSPLNEETPFARYFPHGKSESGDAYFDNVKKTPKNIARLLSCAFYNKEAYKNLRRLIRDEKPDVVYVLQQINALSPSVFKAAKDEGVRVVHRLSDFNIMCPRSDFLCDGQICTACIGGDYSKARERRCCHGSRATTEVRVASMKFHRARRLFGCVDSFGAPRPSRHHCSRSRVWTGARSTWCRPSCPHTSARLSLRRATPTCCISGVSAMRRA